MADATDEDNLVCTRVSSDNWNDVNITYVESPLDRTRDFLRLSWNGIDSCPNYPDEKWRFSIDVVCSDIAIEDSRFFYIGGFDDDTCKIRTQFESKLGCAIVSFSQIWTYLNNNLTIFAIILIVVGVFLCLAGYRILIVTMFIAGFLATVVVLLIVVVQFIITPNTAQYVFWIWLGVSVVIGGLVGFAVAKYRRVGVFWLAFWGGAWLGLLLNNAVIRYTDSQALFWVVIVGCGLAIAILSCFIYVIVAIGSTSLTGSYAAVRGASLFIKHFPNELTVIEEIKNGIVPKTEWQFWAYLAAILVIALLSFFIQWKTRPEKKDKRKKKVKNDEYFRI